jgi:hypothetical protein
MTYIVLRLVAVAGACLWLASGEQIAHATATSANVDSTRLVRLGGTRYRYVEGSLNGTIARDDGPGLPSSSELYPKTFVVEGLSGYRPIAGPGTRPPACRR